MLATIVLTNTQFAILLTFALASVFQIVRAFLFGSQEKHGL